MRKLGLDIGLKSCGIAISDETNLIAQGLENFRFSESDWNSLVNKIIILLKKYDVDTIVIGYPTYSSGDKTATSHLIDQFVSFLNQTINLPIVFINENNTTKKAKQLMRQSGINAKKQKQYKDQLAAQLILEDYLMTLKRQNH